MPKFDFRDKRLKYNLPNGEEMVIGITPEQELDAYNAIEYYKDAQMNNFESKSKEYVEYCHNMIEKIQNYINRNTF